MYSWLMIKTPDTSNGDPSASAKYNRVEAAAVQIGLVLLAHRAKTDQEAHFGNFGAAQEAIDRATRLLSAFEAGQNTVALSVHEDIKAIVLPLVVEEYRKPPSDTFKSLCEPRGIDPSFLVIGAYTARDLIADK